MAKLVNDYVSYTRGDSLCICPPLPTHVGNVRPLMMTSLIVNMSLIN